MTTSVTTINFKVNSAEQFKEMVSEPTPNTALYLTYGKITAWPNDAAPTSANSSIVSEHEIWDNMIGAKKLTANDIRHVIPRYNWTSNTTYIAYDDRSTTLYDTNTQFYVVTSAYGVYKCLANNNGNPSTSEPIATNSEGTTTTADRYVWKYMYTLSDQDLLRYTTANYIPVKTLAADDGSSQWDIQSNADDGSVDVILVTGGGTGYSNNANLLISCVGDGTSLTATGNINVETGTVYSISVTAHGQDYSNAGVIITGGGGTGATARAVLSPRGGHGSNPLYELGGRSLLFNPRLVRSEGGILPETNDLRQIALILDPLLTDGATVADNTAILQAYTIASAGAGNYSEDEIIYQGINLQLATFNGRVVSWNATTGIATTIRNAGTPSTNPLIGANSAIARFLTSSAVGGLDKYSGKMIYADNIQPITRASDQTEDFKIILHFS